ncbi:RNA polymerase sigma factor [Pedobacter mendelii]|uniref:DNA-directed RNA polymerase sigma-70 factor n=1 Tax=Pedobacter mendelii TaxID=1908240 RepID=A0ABQ2BJS2_9SPHI|nr:RNA polymerase sigma-70 factor [Pedobacter mendelii]GGI25712.1 DNA-directed RNA polymerase sigma-70 factor [Pedobacter mendelii]
MKFGNEVANEILIRVKEGDSKAFQIVYDNYSLRLYNFAYRFLKNREQSEEIVQETFITLWTTREHLDERYKMGSYLITVAKRLALNTLRHQCISDTVFEKISKVAINFSNETENHVFYNDLSYYTELIVKKLPNKQQEAFRLSRFQGLSHEQIAKKMQVSENTIKNHISSALKTLRLRLKDVNIFILLSLFLIGKS